MKGQRGKKNPKRLMTFLGSNSKTILHSYNHYPLILVAIEGSGLIKFPNKIDKPLWRKKKPFSNSTVATNTPLTNAIS